MLTPIRIWIGDVVLGVEPLEGPLHLERGAHRALGVVLVGDGRAEQRDERVADDLVDLAAVGLHVGARPRRSSGRRGSSRCSGSSASE